MTHTSSDPPILDHPIVSQHLFFPSSTTVEPTLFVDVGDAKLACYLHQPFPDAGMMLHFHGNGELASSYSTDYVDLFLQAGVNVCFAEYRGYGLSSGTPSLVAMQADGEKIVQALGIAPDRLVVFGRSLGSLYAIELASRIPQIAGVILDSAIANFLELWPLIKQMLQLGRHPSELLDEVNTYFDLQAKLQTYSGDLLVLHTKRDQFLDPSHAQRLYDWAGGTNKRLAIFPFGDHNSIFTANSLSYATELRDFCQRVGIADCRDTSL